jgi:DNA-directed RNA polymerase subunit M/transcription elongation factor TFIIS
MTKRQLSVRDAGHAPDVINQADGLHCPACGEGYLHQQRVEVSDHGDTLRIFFACENCNSGWLGPRKVLNIAYHKGSTIVSWEEGHSA